MTLSRIYLSPPHLDGDEQKFVTEAFASNWIAPLGPQLDAFEQEMGAYTGSPHAVALSSGTAALHVALRLLGVGPGDEVWCSSFTFAASVNPIVYERSQPVFLDSEPTSWNLDPDLLETALTEADQAGRLPKALIVVHLYGQAADMDRIMASCDRRGVPVIEDAAEAVGAFYKGRHVGTMGRFGILSFNGNKIMTTSGGGMLLTRDAAAAGRARFLSTQARDPAPHYQHSEAGFNYRLSNVLAAIGRGQLARIEAKVAARRQVHAWYRHHLGGLPGLAFMPEATFGAVESRANRWLTCILIDPDASGTDREQVRYALENADIEARPVWKPMHVQPVFAHCRAYGGSVSEELFRIGLCLPSGSAMVEPDVERVAAVVRTCWRGSSSARDALKGG